MTTIEIIVLLICIGFTAAGFYLMGKCSGYDKGFKSGRELGKIEGQEKGYEIGNSHGYKRGLDIGFEDGKRYAAAAGHNKEILEEIGVLPKEK